MHRSIALIAALVGASPWAYAASTLNATGGESQLLVMMDGQGPNACGYRSRFATSPTPEMAVTIGDVQIMVTWSERHRNLMGLLKFRVERYQFADGELQSRGTAVLTSGRLSTADFSVVVEPAVELAESPTDAGYFIGPAHAEQTIGVMLPGGLEAHPLIFSFKDAQQEAQENIRFSVELKPEDAQGLAGCSMRLVERGEAALRESPDAS